MFVNSDNVHHVYLAGLAKRTFAMSNGWTLVAAMFVLLILYTVTPPRGTLPGAVVYALDPAAYDKPAVEEPAE